jgi:hypothetical protein
MGAISTGNYPSGRRRRNLWKIIVPPGSFTIAVILVDPLLKLKYHFHSVDQRTSCGLEFHHPNPRPSQISGIWKFHRFLESSYPLILSWFYDEKQSRSLMPFAEYQPNAFSRGLFLCLVAVRTAPSLVLRIPLIDSVCYNIQA